MLRFLPSRLGVRPLAVVTVWSLSVLACEVWADDSLVAHYSFDSVDDSVAHDSGRNGIHGEVHGATYVPLEKGAALEFDGMDDHVRVPASTHLRLEKQLSLEVWLNPRVVSTGTVISKNGCSTLRQNYGLNQQESGLLFQSVKCPELEMMVRTGRLLPDRWSHVATTCDGRYLKIYIDGELRSSEDLGEFALGSFDGPLFIGANHYGGRLGSHYQGQVDDLRIYNRALSADEVQARFQAETGQRVSRLSALRRQLSTFSEADTTPPTASVPAPPPDSTVDREVTVAAEFADVGSGVDIANVRVLLDGSDVTSQAEVKESGFTLGPLTLTKTVHQVDVSLKDRAGNVGNRLRWRFGVKTRVKVEAKFVDGVFYVSGEPYFPLGIYAGSTSYRRAHLGYLPQAVAAGINFQMVGEAGEEVLDAYLRHGMKLLKAVTFGAMELAKGDPRRMEGLLTTREHPGMLAWWTEFSSPDQAHLLTGAYRVLKEKDPNHPVAFMHTWAGVHCDVYFVYAYPILNPLHDNNDIVSLYEGGLKEAFEAAKAEGKGKHVWFGSQAFDYRIDSGRGKVLTLEGGFRPSREEIRAMNYLALAKGVNGLLYYAPGADIPDTEYVDDFAIQPRQWTEALKTARQIRHLTPELTLGKAGSTARLRDETGAIHFREIVHKGVHTLIAVNVERDDVLACWSFENAVQPHVLFEDRLLAQPGREITDLFRPLEVHVYQWTRAQ